MSKVPDTQHTCARCHRRFAEPQPNRRGSLCEDCLNQDDQPR